MASISWTGGTLTNAWQGTPAGRVNALEPDSHAVGQVRRLLATGAPRMWKYREDHTASFELRDIPNTNLELCTALGLHLSEGGVVEVTMDDTTGATYPNCVLAPGAEAPQPKLADPQAMRYRMTFTLLNLDGTPLVAVY